MPLAKGAVNGLGNLASATLSRRAAALGLPDVARHEQHRPYLGRTTEAQFVGIGLVRTMPAPCPYGLRAVHDPLGRRRIKRQAETVRAVHRVRPQGRNATASRMGRGANRISAVP